MGHQFHIVGITGFTTIQTTNKINNQDLNSVLEHFLYVAHKQSALKGEKISVNTNNYRK
jgi:flagellar motor switch protein FliG